MVEAESGRHELSLIGRIVADRYHIERLLGQGGVGAVYEATRLEDGRRIAIKLVLRAYAGDDAVVSRFAREAKAASAARSPHIVEVFDSGVFEGQPFLVMELLVGEDLGARLKRLRRLSEPETVHVALQIVSGLIAAHAAGVVHRDLKPDNVILTERDGDALFVKIVDFGTSKIIPHSGRTAPLALTHRGVVVGTPLYMSPEQAEARSDVDERGDLYSVGAIAFECLSGRPPHVGESDELVLASIRSTTAPALRSVEPGVSSELAALVDKALARDRTARFASAREMREALVALAPNDPAANLPLRIVVGPAAGPSLGLADTLPHADKEPGSHGTASAGLGVPGTLLKASLRREIPSDANSPGGGGLALADTVPRSPDKPAALLPSARPKQSSISAFDKAAASPRSSRAAAGRHFGWSAVAVFAATLGGVVTTAWVASRWGQRQSEAELSGADSSTASLTGVGTAPQSRTAPPLPKDESLMPDETPRENDAQGGLGLDGAKE
jgi:serine/threonine protein kinase